MKPTTSDSSPASNERPTFRDPDTIALIGEFLSEGEESLGRADRMLMTVERDHASAEAINDLFRVFHTIKGTAGFLELTDIIHLAHTTETMLNRCREGALALSGAPLDLVFDATSVMRTMLSDLRVSIEHNTPICTPPELGTLLHKIATATEGGWVPEEQLPFAAPEDRLGDVITQPPLNIPQEVIRDALAAQAETGRRVGEELVSRGAATPKQIAQGLRAQNRTRESISGQPSKLRETIKVDVERVDSLVEMIGELVVVEAMLAHAPEIQQAASPRVRNFLAQFAKVTHDLQDVGMRMRMLPVDGVFQKMARMVRDLSRKNGKQVVPVLEGQSTEMDRSMVEQIADPLLHMIRNAVDHGIEPPEERQNLGKPQDAIVKLSAFHEGGSIVIEVSDDGRGLNRDAIRTKALAQKLIKTTDELSESEIDELIFTPGFSTAAKVTEISGRGVGMDVVKRNIEAMHGRVAIHSLPGAGTTFKIILPLTLAIIDGMLVACGKERYIIPTLSIIESTKPNRSMLLTLGHTNEMIKVRSEIYPLLRLDRLLGAQDAKTDPSEALVIIVEGAGHRLGLLVDEVIAQQQVVIKTLGTRLSQVSMISGAAVLADGRIGLIINVDEIVAMAGERRYRGPIEGRQQTRPFAA
jgi:two-component system chemotaxis sensor kinase CheA